jgi:hypothetical protein
LHKLEGERSLTNVRYEYVRSFEQPDVLLSNTWIVVRIDGRGFSKYVALSFFELLIVLLFPQMQVPVEFSEISTPWPLSRKIALTSA